MLGDFGSNVEHSTKFTLFVIGGLYMCILACTKITCTKIILNLLSKIISDKNSPGVVLRAPFTELDVASFVMSTGFMNI